MARMIRHASQALYEPRDPWQGLELHAEAVGPGVLPQGRFDAGYLLRPQPRLASRPPRGAQRRAPALPPSPLPTQDTLATGAQAAGDGGLRLHASGEEPRHPLLTKLQCIEIASRCNVSAHAFIAQRSCALVTVLCEIQ